MDNALLRAADSAARRVHVSRSALIREAVREHLKRLRIRDLEIRDRSGYERRRDEMDDLATWEAAAAWPDS